MYNFVHTFVNYTFVDSEGEVRHASDSSIALGQDCHDSNDRRRFTNQHKTGIIKIHLMKYNLK